MAAIIFQGSSALTLDGKGRIAMPTRHRDILAAVCANQLSITRSPEGSLVIFPRPTWEELRERIAAWPMEASGWRRIYLGSAMDVEIDNSGRVLISPELRRAAGLEREVMLIGMGSHFELWDTQRLEARETTVLQSEAPQAVKDFSF